MSQFNHATINIIAIMDKSLPETIASIINFIDRSKSIETERFIEQTRKEADEFQRQFETDATYIITPQEELKLNEWVFSGEGKQQIKALIEVIVEIIAETAHNGNPAHDKRHFIQTLFSSLRFVIEDDITDYHLLLLIASFLHDLGRLAEEKLFGRQLGGVLGVDHPKISFALTETIFKHFPDIPEILRDHILYAILVHQQKNSDIFMAAAVQRGDREQLVGSEGIYRIIAFNVGLQNSNIKTAINEKRKKELALPGTENDTDVMHHIEFYMRNLYPVIGNKGEEYITKLKIISGIFLYLANTDKVREQIFAPEISKDNNLPFDPDNLKFKKPFTEEVWRVIKQGPDIETKEKMKKFLEQNLEGLLIDFIGPANATVTHKEVFAIREKLSALNHEEANRLHEGITYAMVMQQKLEEEQAKLIAYTSHTFPLDSIEYEIVTGVKCQLNKNLLRKR